MKILFPELAPLVKREKPTYGLLNRSIIYRPENICVCKLHTSTIMVAIVCDDDDDDDVEDDDELFLWYG